MPTQVDVVWVLVAIAALRLVVDGFDTAGWVRASAAAAAVHRTNANTRAQHSALEA